MPSIDDIVKNLKETKWEDSSQSEIEAFRLTIAAFKLTTPGRVATPVLREILRDQLTGKGGHARDKLAIKLFNHYLDLRGRDYLLSIEDVKIMNSTTLPVPGPIDIRKKTYTSPAINPAWTAAIAMSKKTKSDQTYSGSLLWAWDNGAIANYTVKYDGKLSVSSTGVVLWSGHVIFQDRFDLDPRWGWSPTTPGGRSRRGERRTRIGYMLALGTDFDIKGPKALATQRASIKHLVFSGIIIGPAPVTTPSDDIVN